MEAFKSVAAPKRANSLICPHHSNTLILNQGPIWLEANIIKPVLKEKKGLILMVILGVRLVC